MKQISVQREASFVREYIFLDTRPSVNSRPVFQKWPRYIRRILLSLITLFFFDKAHIRRIFSQISSGRPQRFSPATFSRAKGVDGDGEEAISVDDVGDGGAEVSHDGVGDGEAEAISLCR